MSIEDLQQELKSIEQQLTKPEVFSDYKKVAELGKRHAEVTRELFGEQTGSVGTKKSEAIVEIRAGTGGEEAALFAGKLFEMYKKYADKKGIPYAIIIGPDEASKNMVTLRDMKTREQKTVSLKRNKIHTQKNLIFKLF